jgi:hypothetical protein
VTQAHPALTKRAIAWSVTVSILILAVAITIVQTIGQTDTPLTRATPSDPGVGHIALTAYAIAPQKQGRDVRHDTPDNIATLARLFGFSPSVAQAWLVCEGQTRSLPSNPLNLRAGGVSASTQIGVTNGWAVFASPADGLAAAYAVVSKLAPAYGYGRILASASDPDPVTAARAIEFSSWAAGHYGAHPASPGCLEHHLLASEVHLGVAVAP